MLSFALNRNGEVKKKKTFELDKSQAKINISTMPADGFNSVFNYFNTFHRHRTTGIHSTNLQSTESVLCTTDTEKKSK